ncbi:MAG: PKD-like domain-containing protein [Bacteroidota bacterium]
MEPSPTVAAVSDQEVCNESSTAAITFSGGPSFSWTNDKSSIGLPASGTGNIAAFTALNNSPFAVVATIVVTPTAGLCSGSTTSFTITVDPTPVVNPIADLGVCNGANTTAINFTGTGTTYTWTNNAAIGLAGSGTGDIASFAAINNGNSPVVATIVVTPVFTGGTTCNGATKSFTITVNPTPTVAAPGTQEVCNGASTTDINFSGIATQYDWTNDSPSIGIPAIGTGNIFIVRCN